MKILIANEIAHVTIKLVFKNAVDTGEWNTECYCFFFVLHIFSPELQQL